MKTVDELIDSIIVNEANFEHIAKSRKINGNLRAEIKRIMSVFAKQHEIADFDITAVKCPECLQQCSQDELDTFGGLCEECKSN
ncbi:MAG: hypothetical protein RBS07_07680 [Lentimicrobium sp.]|jgi:hypothetical protein|nr:hypothetical protein [Lentimicrobium sp.]